MASRATDVTLANIDTGPTNLNRAPCFFRTLAHVNFTDCRRRRLSLKNKAKEKIWFKKNTIQTIAIELIAVEFSRRFVD